MIEQPNVTPPAAEALSAHADRVINEHVIPKKIPEFHDVNSQTKAVGGALASALLTATDMPLHHLQPVVADLASQLVALGIRQTEHVDPDAVHTPAWITDGVRQQSVKLPEQPKHTDVDPVVARTGVAPEPPKRIPHRHRAVRV